MSEEHNLEEINRKFGSLNETLESLKAQNALNIGDTSRVLNNLNVKIDNLSSNIDMSAVKENLYELKDSLEDRYSFVNVRFAELEASFKSLLERKYDEVTKPQVQELFDTLSTNITIFSKQMMAQGDILNEITLRIEALRTDDTDKKDVLKNIAFLRSDLEKFNNGFESIVFNINNNFEGVFAKLSEVDFTVDTTEIKNRFEALNLTINAILSSLQIADQKSNNIDEILRNIIEQNDKINANIKSMVGQSDFDAFHQKIEDAIEIIKTLRGALTDANDQSQKALVVELDKLSNTVSKILTEEDFEIFKNELSKIISEAVEATTVLRGDLLETSSDLKRIIFLIENLDLKEATTAITNFVENSQKALRTNIIETITTENFDPIKENLNSIMFKLDQSKDLLAESFGQNNSSIINKLDNLSSNLNQLQDTVTFLPDLIKKNQTAFEESQKTFIQQNSQNLSDISDKISGIKNEVNNFAPITNAIIPEITSLKTLVISEDGLNSKINNLETIMARVAGDYDVALHSLKENLMKGISNIQNDCESVDLKFNNFSFELNGLKNEFQTILDNIKLLSANQNEKLDNTCSVLNAKIEEILQSISSMTYDLNSKLYMPKQYTPDNNQEFSSQDPSTITCDGERITQWMKDIFCLISEIKIKVMGNSVNVAREAIEGTGSISEIFVQDIESKLNKIKEQLSFNSTDMMENLYNRTETIIREIEPIREVISNLLDIDFKSISQNLKDQVNFYKISLEKINACTSSPESNNILDNLFHSFGELEKRIDNIDLEVKNNQTEFLTDLKNSINQVLSTSNGDTPVGSFSQDFINKIDEKLSNVESIQKRFDSLEEKVDSICQNSEANISNQLTELFEKLANIQEYIINCRPSEIRQENVESSNVTEETSTSSFVAMPRGFAEKLDEVYSLVKYTSDNVDEKLTYALSNNEQNVNFEDLKSDIEKVLSNIKNCTIEDENGEEHQLSVSKNDEINQSISQILEEIRNLQSQVGVDKELKQSLDDFNKNASGIITNQEYKDSMDNALTEIKTVIAEQQKMFKTINVLEALASLEDISNLKGIEQLNRLSEIISVEKLNALSKLENLDHLEKLNALENLDKIPDLDDLVDLQEALQDIATNIEQKISEVANNSSVESVSTDIKNELNTVKTTIMKHVLNVFEQLSFVVEGEEIKDFVDEKTNNLSSIIEENVIKEIKAIKHSLDTTAQLEYSDIEPDLKKIDAIDGNISDVRTQIDEIKTQIADKSELKTQIEELKEGLFNEIKSQFNVLKSGAEDDLNEYSYSIQDIESDIAKLRLALKEIQTATENNSLKEITDYVNEIVQSVDSMKFNLTQDDIFRMRGDIEKISSSMVSVSSRTNKLLLNSDETKEYLINNLNTFKTFMDNLYESLKKLDYTTVLAKLDDVVQQINDESKHQKSINDSLAKLSIWSDNTDEQLIEITENINRIKKTMPNNEAIIDALEEKFVKQQQKIDSLEEKIDDLTSAFESSDTNELSKKINNIDKQLAKLNRSIEKLTSYVDEE